MTYQLRSNILLHIRAEEKILFAGLDLDLEEEVPISADGATTDKLALPGQASPASRPLTPLFRWFKDGSEFNASERFQCQFDDSEDTLALVFQHVTPGNCTTVANRAHHHFADDAGLYTCVASTTGGKISCSAELTVQGDVHRLLRDPEKPEVKSPITEVEVNEGSSAMIDAKVSGYPLPKVQWYHDGEEVNVDDRHKVLKEDEESYTLVIKNVQAEDAGKYMLKVCCNACVTMKQMTCLIRRRTSLEVRRRKASSW